MPRACQNLNPFSPWIDQKAISPHIVDTFSNSKVMRKKKKNRGEDILNLGSNCQL